MKPIASGYVLSAGKTDFWCRFTFGKEPGQAVDARFLIRDLLKRERKLLIEGAYVSMLTGGTIRFVRLKPFTKQESKEITERGEQLFAALRWK